MAIQIRLLKLRGFLALTLMCLASSGCATPQGLVRTPLDKWETKRFASLGFSIEVPKQASEFSAKYALTLCDTQDDEDYLGLRCIFLKLHPIWSGSLLVEPHYLLVMSFSRIAEPRLLKRKDTIFTNAFYNVIDTNLSSGPFEKGCWKYLRFRKDYRLDNGYVLICEAKLLRMVEEEDSNFRSDTNAIQRILNSVKH